MGYGLRAARRIRPALLLRANQGCRLHACSSSCFVVVVARGVDVVVTPRGCRLASRTAFHHCKAATALA